MITEEIQSFTKNWREPVQFITAVVALVAGAKGIVVPKAQEMLGVQGPSMIIQDLKVEPTLPGKSGIIRMNVDKLRNCKLLSASFTLSDSKGMDWPLQHTYTLSLPAGRGLKPTFEYHMPSSVAAGEASVMAIVNHENCTDGGKPPAASIAKTSVTVTK